MKTQTQNRDYGDEGVITCPGCEGAGMVYPLFGETECPICNGLGEMPENKISTYYSSRGERLKDVFKRIHNTYKYR